MFWLWVVRANHSLSGSSIFFGVLYSCLKLTTTRSKSLLHLTIFHDLYISLYIQLKLGNNFRPKELKLSKCLGSRAIHGSSITVSVDHQSGQKQN